MPTATSRRAPAPDELLEERDTLCRELIALKRDSLPVESLISAIEARLKQIADERKESFKITLPNGDYVAVAPPCAAEFKGNTPVLQTEAWQALKPAKQEKLIKSGLVKIEPQWGRASGGRVSVKTF